MSATVRVPKHQSKVLTSKVSSDPLSFYLSAKISSIFLGHSSILFDNKSGYSPSRDARSKLVKRPKLISRCIGEHFLCMDSE